MDRGEPVAVQFTEEEGDESHLLYCELIQEARFGKSFIMKSQGCRVGAYVLGETEITPGEYYFSTGRYGDRNASEHAVSGLHRFSKKIRSIKITPYSGKDFDILVLFLKPERAMRLVQAITYPDGKTVEFRTGGTASICSDCTAYPARGKPAISLGCKGSRKHSKYPDEELIAAIPFQFAEEIDSALDKIPETFV